MTPILRCLSVLALALAPIGVGAEPAASVLKRDFAFPEPVEGMPARLSEFPDLQINAFTTNDGVSISYWEAGSGEPVLFVPAWGSNGAELIDVIWLLSRTHHVYVMDPRNQGLSERTAKGQRIARHAMDLNQLLDHLELDRTVLAGWSMGAAVIWAYVDLFGTDRITRAVFVDQPVSIYTHADWTEEQRLNAGGMTTSPERMIAAFAGAPTNQQVVDMKVTHRARMLDTPHIRNATSFAQAVIPSDPDHAALVLFDHATNDWRDVVSHKLDMPVAVFSGEESNNLPSQAWIARTVPDGRLYSYTAEQQGDHMLMLKNPVGFVSDLRAFLAGE